MLPGKHRVCGDEAYLGVALLSAAQILAQEKAAALLFLAKSLSA